MRPCRALVLIALSAALAACGQKPAPRRAAAAAPAAAPAANVVAAAEAAKKPVEEEWVYSSVGKRDPFRSFLAELTSEKQKAETRCATPLGRFEIEQLKLVAVVTGLEDPVAMVEAPNGVGYSLRRGACIGKNGGVVAAVRSDGVVVSEWVIRGDGTRDSTQTVLRLPKQAALNLEE
jgi:type IV pilus assembly protein PilP